MQKKRQSRVSSGLSKARNIARQEKKLAKFAKKKSDGNAYSYVPMSEIPEKDRERIRAERSAKSGSKKTPLARWVSINAKLDNQMAKEKELAKIIN